MKLDGEIILIDNDRFEFDFLEEALRTLEFEVGVTYLPTAADGLAYLQQTKKEIFLIISEMDFDGMGGMELKEQINNGPNTHWKSIPFIFIANSASRSTIDKAYKLDIHGFFKKPEQLQKLTRLFSVIIEYWILNLHPNKSERFYD